MSEGRVRLGKSKKKKKTWSRRKRKGKPPRPQAGERVQLKEGVEFECPDCGQHVTAGHDGLGRPFIMHRQPTCKTFMELEPDEYLKWARLKMEGTTDA